MGSHHHPLQVRGWFAFRVIYVQKLKDFAVLGRGSGEEGSRSFRSGKSGFNTFALFIRLSLLLFIFIVDENNQFILN